MDIVPSRRIFRSGLLIVCLSLGACSPYVYKSEVATFGQGVDSSVQVFQSLMPQYTARKIKQSGEELLTEFKRNNEKPSVSDGCESLRRKYRCGFTEGREMAGDLLTAKDYEACHVTPVPKTNPDEELSNLTALGEALKSYAAGLATVTDAQDETALRKAFGDLNVSANALFTEVNKKLVKENKETLNAVGALVYQVGLTYLRQRRFDALKQALNANDPAVDRAAGLLAEGAFDIYNLTLTDKKEALNKAENKAFSTTESDFVTVWSDIKKARDVYVKAFQDSPIYAFAKIKTTHDAALRDSVNDPTNQAQLDALYENAAALKKAAEAALKAARSSEGG